VQNIYLLIIIALVIGAILPLQIGVNAKLADAVGSPLISAFLSFLVGTLSLLTYILITGIPLSGAAGARNASPAAWTGGMIGAVYVAMSIILLPKLGAALTIALIVAGQMIMSVITDHFGVLGVEVRPISPGRLAGIALVIAGVALIRKF
jgi:transporter family-2 protein